MSTNNENSNWEDLPFNSLLLIFTYLKINERLVAALVCRKWAIVFQSPTLWRSISFELTQFLGNNSIKKCGFAERYGRFLEKLNIYCEKENFIQNTKKLTVKESLSNFFHILFQQGTQLKELHLRDCNLILILCIANRKGGRFFLFILRRFPLISQSIKRYFLNSGYVIFREIQQKLIQCLIPFLESQERLEIFDGKNMCASVEIGCNILKAITVNSGTTLKSLRADSLFHFNQFIYREPTFFNIIKNFTSLKKLSLNYNCISDKLLEILAQSCGNTLAYFLIHIIWADPHDHVIGNEQWENFTKLCINVKVGIQTKNIPHHRDLTPILVRSIPLILFQFIIGHDREENESVWDIKILIKHIRRNYSLCLEKLYIEFYNQLEDIDFEILSFVAKCVHLKELIIESVIHLSTVIAICNFRKTGATELQKFHVHIININSPIEKKELEQIKNEFQPLEKDNCLEFHFTHQ